jgi:hypothetical protein
MRPPLQGYSDEDYRLHPDKATSKPATKANLCPKSHPYQIPVDQQQALIKEASKRQKI